jgi:hypothetical protein
VGNLIVYSGKPGIDSRGLNIDICRSLFVSDIAVELDAAWQTGMNTIVGSVKTLLRKQPMAIRSVDEIIV